MNDHPQPARPAFVFERQMRTKAFLLQVLAAGLRILETIAVTYQWIPYPFLADIGIQLLAQQWGLMIDVPRVEWDEDRRDIEGALRLKSRGPKGIAALKNAGIGVEDFA